jgi:hypothetical protein
LGKIGNADVAARRVAGKLNLAGGGGDDAGDDLEECALPRPIWPNHGDLLSVLQPKTDPFQSGIPVQVHTQVIYFEKGGVVEVYDHPDILSQFPDFFEDLHSDILPQDE